MLPSFGYCAWGSIETSPLPAAQLIATRIIIKRIGALEKQQLKTCRAQDDGQHIARRCLRQPA
jgi:hypothetical protein